MSGRARGGQKKSSKCEPEPAPQRRPRAQLHAAPSAAPAASHAPDHKRNEPPAEKPSNPEPGPEFYASLKRETDEILKITEEANSKYGKKVIQSNWKKYEVPIETYEERDELENIGADYEQLVNAPISTGGHFQFKHEKTWDLTTKPSEYDKYFNINVKRIGISLCSIPFYQRNDLDVALFPQGDVIAMEYRAKKFKQKFCQETHQSLSNDNIDPTDKLLASLQESLHNEIAPKEDDIDFTIETHDSTESNYIEPIADNKKIEGELIVNLEKDFKESPDDELEVLLRNEDISMESIKSVEPAKPVEPTKPMEPTKSMESRMKPVLESREDLEQWLDDFLDS